MDYERFQCSTLYFLRYVDREKRIGLREDNVLVHLSKERRDRIVAHGLFSFSIAREIDDIDECFLSLNILFRSTNIETIETR